MTDLHQLGPQIFHGQVGWLGEDKYYDIGDESNDGHTLVRVQLYSGRDTTEPLIPHRAQGMKIVCQLSGQLYRIPPVGTRVIVAAPYGLDGAGNGVIIATQELSPNATNSVALKASRVSMDFPGQDLVISAKSVTIRDYENDFVSVGKGVTVQSSNGSGMLVKNTAIAMFLSDGSVGGGAATSTIMMDTTGIKLVNGTSSFVTLSDGGFHAFGISATLQGAATYVGATPTAVTAAANGTATVTAVAAIATYIAALTAAFVAEPAEFPASRSALITAGGTIATALTTVYPPLGKSLSTFVSIV